VRIRIGAQILAEDRCWERHGRDAQQEQQVQEQQRPIHFAEEVEQRVVVDPNDADGEEADRVHGVRGPLAQQGRRQAVLVGRRHAQLEHQQRGGNAEHTITEGFEPCRPHRGT
jgi:hypothetical protein